MTLRISGSLYVTSNTFFHEISQLILLLTRLLADTDPAQKTMAERMKEKLDKYWGSTDKMNLNIYIAVVLDPRFKLKYPQFIVQRLYDKNSGSALASLIKSASYEMFNDYYLKLSSQTCDLSSSMLNLEKATAAPNSKSEEYDALFELFKENDSELNSATAFSELDKYLNEGLEPKVENFDILNWWKLNSQRFPILSQMARNVLAAPISTVSSESTFSTGGRILDQFRSSLTPKIVEALICTQDWMRAKWSSKPINVEESIEELDKFYEGLNFDF